MASSPVRSSSTNWIFFLPLPFPFLPPLPFWSAPTFAIFASLGILP